MIAKAAQFVKEAKMVILSTGTGMGIDSGVPNFRGTQCFWNHYPAYKDQFSYAQCSNPDFLKSHPNVFWGFYGHRLELYREKQPHGGYQILKQMAATIAGPDGTKDNLFAITSNVDGHFQKAGYSEDRIHEVHGSIQYLQCYDCQVIVPNNFQPDIQETTMTCKNLPLCPECKDPMRPNILMLGDWEWLPDRSQKQENNFRTFMSTHANEHKVLIEIGSGLAVQNIRNLSQKLFYKYDNLKLIRINLDSNTSSADWLDPNRYLDIRLSALDAIKQIKQHM